MEAAQRVARRTAANVGLLRGLRQQVQFQRVAADAVRRRALGLEAGDQFIGAGSDRPISSPYRGKA